MNKKQRVSIAVISTAVASLAVTYVTASPPVSSTPLYTFRMEQASSEMSFLPTAVNEFTYSTRNLYTLNYEFAEESDVVGAIALEAEPLYYTGPFCTWARRFPCQTWWRYKCYTWGLHPCYTWWRYPPGWIFR